jgi:hypothetical protein
MALDQAVGKWKARLGRRGPARSEREIRTPVIFKSFCTQYGESGDPQQNN